MKITVFFFLSIILNGTQGERLHKQIYSSIEGGAACFRRLNGTHQAGCSSSDNGAVGVVQIIKNVSDAEWMALKGLAGPYVAVVSTSLFHQVIELFMKNSHNVAGVLLYENATSRSYAFSQESRCPNEYSSAKGSQCSSSDGGMAVWNEPGTGLLRRDIPFPIFYLPKAQAAEIDKIETCYKRYNLDKENQKEQPLCSLQLSAFMFAAVNSEICMRRSAANSFMQTTKFCDPLGDHNVHYSLFPRAKASDEDSVTLVTARIDSASLFDGISPGAAGSVIGMSTLITAASLLAKMIPTSETERYKHNILWALFNGETFDYIGSQRVAYDLSRGAWPPPAPLRPAQVALHAELGQLGGSLLRAGQGQGQGEGWPLTAFAPYTSDMPQEVTEFLNEISVNLNQYKMSVAPLLGSSLPPSSLHSFRRVLGPESGGLPQLLLVDHGDTFTNMFYHSALDDGQNVGFVYRNISVDNNGTFVETAELLADGTLQPRDPQVQVARLATALARTLYQRVVGARYNASLEASAHLVDEMLHCFLERQSCRLLAAAEYAARAAPAAEAPDRPAPLYVGVAAWGAGGAVLAGHLLALLAGRHRAENRSRCDELRDPGYSYYWLRGWNDTGVCVETTMNFTQAVSPAFIIPDYSFSSGVYSTWTESVWQGMWARVFVAAAGAGARRALAAGAAATALAALLTYWLRRHAAVVFTADARTASGILRTVNC